MHWQTHMKKQKNLPPLPRVYVGNHHIMCTEEGGVKELHE